MNRTLFPYLNTRFETDILLTLLLTPLWWLTGFNIFAYQLSAALAFMKLLMANIFGERTFAIPNLLIWFGFFLCSYLFSILINMGNHAAQRVAASFNNYLVFLMGFLLMLAVYNGKASFLSNLFKIARILCVVTGLIASCFLVLWSAGYRELEIPSLLGQWAPGLLEFPFFRELLLVRITSSDWLITLLPRFAIYSQVQTALGGFMLMMLPLAMASFEEKKRTFEFWLLLLLSAVPIFFSLSRTVWCAFIASYVIVRFLERERKLFQVMLLFAVILTTSNFIYSGFEWLLKLRHQSTINRLEIYEQAIKIVMETNILTGIGVRLREGRDEFLMMSLGSHSTYVGLLLVTGLIGLGLFIGFQIVVGLHWFRLKKPAEGKNTLRIWRYLGMSYGGASLWFFTDTLDALPFIAYIYFAIIAAILLFGRTLKEGQNAAFET